MNLNEAISGATEFNKVNITAVFVVQYKSGEYGWFDECDRPYLQESVGKQLMVIHPNGYIHSNMS